MQQLKQFADLQWILRERLNTSLAEIADFCKRWNIVELALFGSVLRDDFCLESDVDVLVVYQPNTEQTLDDITRAKTELETLFNREVDLTQKRGLINPFSRREILQQHRVIYPPEKAEPITISIANKQMQDNVRNYAAIWDVVQAIQRIETFTQGLDEAAYLGNILVQQAVERNLEIIGEAARRRITEEFRNTHPEIDWRGVIGLRNVVAHQYEQINQEQIWQIITTILPNLQEQLQALLPPEDDADE
ncbi:MAG: HepT-like ribonuclease domain-containing protein [Lyngbya sp.]|nr:HepT-like ribonuclease domain-containing protein [Lyngbya sp.]